MSWIRDFKQDPAVIGFYDKIRLPYAYENMLSNLVSIMNWGFDESVQKYSRLQPGIQLISEEHYIIHKREMVIENITYLKNAFEFLSYASNSPLEIQPILFHYSWQLFSSFFKHTFFKWNSRATGHGIRIGRMEGPTDVEVELIDRSTGSFQRLLDCLNVLGVPTLYGNWLPTPENKSLRFEKNELPHSLANRRKCPLTDILAFMSTDQARKFVEEASTIYREQGYSLYSDLVRSINEELLSYVIVFVASSMARYRPALWRKVIDASDESSSKMYDSVNDAYSHYMRGRPLSTHYVDIQHSFLSDTKEIIERTQNKHWLETHFNGSFASSRL